MTKLYSVYIHTCPNGKRYVGITTQKPEDRWFGGLNYRNNAHFFRAIKAYGWENIIHEVITSNITEEQATEMEVNLIKTLNTMNPKFGYNNTSGGEVGKEYSEESIKKMSENRKNIYCGKDHHCYGKTREEIFGVEGVKKIVEQAKARWSGEENPQKKNPKFGKENPNFGRVYSKEIRLRMAEGRKDKKLKSGDALKMMELYYQTDLDQKKISEMFGVTRQTVGDVIWRRIHADETKDFIKPTNKTIRKRAINGKQRNTNS